MLSRHAPIEEVLRRALKHAGIVEGWEHVCRKCSWPPIRPVGTSVAVSPDGSLAFVTDKRNG